MSIRLHARLDVVVVLAALAGCSSAHDAPHVSAAVGSTAALTIGPEGGELTLGDARFTIPAGALHESHEIRITVTDESGPAAFGHFSPVYHLEPEGLALDVPARVNLPFEGRAAVATVFHRDQRAAAYVAGATNVVEDLAGADLRVLGRAFVGSGSSESTSCRPATSELDVLLAVDDSGSMVEEQDALAAELPRLAHILATGDFDEDGIQDFPAASSIQWGNVTSDLGAGGVTIPTCDGLGDNAALRSVGASSDPSCAPEYAGILSYDTSADGADAASFSHDVSCVARAGANGCGVEQTLEASLRALQENASLRRANSILAVINLTDEDDTSFADPDLYNLASPTYSGDLNLRDFYYPSALHPVSRYVDGLLAMRADPSTLVYAAIAGVPADLVGDASASNYSEILADPRMTQQVDETGHLLVAACSSASGGRAFPAQRLVQTADALHNSGVATVVQSICADNLDSAANAIAHRIADALSGTCP